jgi:hypothetical protein
MPSNDPATHDANDDPVPRAGLISDDLDTKTAAPGLPHTYTGPVHDLPATVWDLAPQDFNIAWSNNGRASGFSGLTLHATAAGKPTASLTLAGFTTDDLSNSRISVTFGNDPASGSAYLKVHSNSWAQRQGVELPDSNTYGIRRITPIPGPLSAPHFAGRTRPVGTCPPPRHPVARTSPA